MTAATFDPSSFRLPANTEERVDVVEQCMHFSRPPAEFSKEELEEEIVLTEVALRLNESLLWKKAMNRVTTPQYSSKIAQAVSSMGKFADLIDLPKEETVKLLSEMRALRTECVEEGVKQTEKKALLDMMNEEYAVRLRTLKTFPPLETAVAEMEARLPELEQKIKEESEKKETLTKDIDAINIKLRKGVGNKVNLKASLEKKKKERTAADAFTQILEEEKKQLEADLFAKNRSLMLTKGDMATFLNTFSERRKKIDDEITRSQEIIDAKTARMDAIRVFFKSNVIWGEIGSHVIELQQRRDALEDERAKRI